MCGSLEQGDEELGANSLAVLDVVRLVHYYHLEVLVEQRFLNEATGRVTQ